VREQTTDEGEALRRFFSFAPFPIAWRRFGGTFRRSILPRVNEWQTQQAGAGFVIDFVSYDVIEIYNDGPLGRGSIFPLP